MIKLSRLNETFLLNSLAFMKRISRAVGLVEWFTWMPYDQEVLGSVLAVIRSFF